MLGLASGTSQRISPQRGIFCTDALVGNKLEYAYMPLFFDGLALAVTALIGWLYLYGTDNFLFWRYPWYDAPLHILGGIVIGLWGSAVASRMRLRPLYTTLLVAVLALLVGIGWEVLEQVAGFREVTDVGYWVDTAQDLVCGTAGALAVIGLYWAFYKKE